MATPAAVALRQAWRRGPQVGDLALQQLELAGAAAASIAFIGERQPRAQPGPQHRIVGRTVEGGAQPVLLDPVRHETS